MNTPRSDKAWKAYKYSSNAQHIRSESCRLETELAEMKGQWRMSSVCRELRAENDELKAKLETAERDSGLYCATLKLSAQKLGCEEHMVDHAVSDLIAKLEKCRAALDNAENALSGTLDAFSPDSCPTARKYAKLAREALEETK